MMPPILHVWKARYDAKNVLPSALSLFVLSWQALVRNLRTFVLIICVPFAIIMAGVWVVLTAHGTSVQNPVEAIGGVLMCLGVLLACFVPPMLIYAQLRSAQRTVFSYKDALRAGLHYALNIWALLLLTYVLAVVGLVLLVVPGLFVLRRYLLAPYFLIDEDLGILAAMRSSAQKSATYSPSVWSMLGVYASFLAVWRFVPFVGSLLSLVLFTLYSCAAAVRYEQIKAKDLVKIEQKQVRARAKKIQRRSKKKS